MFVLMEVCCSDRPMASATLMKRFAKSVSRMGSGPPLGVFDGWEGMSMLGMAFLVLGGPYMG